jgi:hypothetical protein
LREEARTLQALTHPYLIRVYGIVETSDELSVVCERCTGGHFRERVMRRRIGEDMRAGQGRYRCWPVFDLGSHGSISVIPITFPGTPQIIHTRTPRSPLSLYGLIHLRRLVCRTTFITTYHTSLKQGPIRYNPHSATKQTFC